jgi:hypothetical protein
MAAILSLERKLDLLGQTGIRKQFAIKICILLSPVGPFIEMRKLNTKDGSLKSIQSRIQSDPLVIVTFSDP